MSFIWILIYTHCLYTWLNHYIVFVSGKMYMFFICFDNYDMFHIPLSWDSLGDLRNEYVYVCMYPRRPESSGRLLRKPKVSCLPSTFISVKTRDRKRERVRENSGKCNHYVSQSINTIWAEALKLSSTLCYLHNFQSFNKLDHSLKYCHWVKCPWYRPNTFWKECM
jgi:hypothetical protein